ncbi:hypothetical protein CRENBAI_007874 [Crenichthys baileyi]|uniref:Uncharacterized protein n=1 Tax=Crenichthys baileyi TaxID=28760 RepID=A0AAV9RZ75_9TELE
MYCTPDKISRINTPIKLGSSDVNQIASLLYPPALPASGSSSSAPPCRERETGRESWRPPPHLTTPTLQALSQRPHPPTPSERGHRATGLHSRREDRSGIPALFRPQSGP